MAKVTHTHTRATLPLHMRPFLHLNPPTLTFFQVMESQGQLPLQGGVSSDYWRVGADDEFGSLLPVTIDMCIVQFFTQCGGNVCVAKFV